jgi:subtilisin-like proprotein convertase family protein
MKGIFFLITMATAISGMAQTYPMQDGATQESCTGFFQDSGGISGDYSNNEDLTMTFCPVAPDSVLSINFNLFNLGDGDQLMIYQGSDTSSPIGAFTGTEAQGQTFTSDPENYDGCLTFQFVSDDAGVGNFAGELSCGYPCVPPIADVDTDQEGDTLLVCIGEEIEFDGTGSTTAEDYEIVSYTWDWGDNTQDSTGGLVQTHSFDSPGDYTVNLFVTDENDCSNNNLTEVIVLVSTIPEFVGTTEDVLACINEGVSLELLGSVEPITWDGTPDIDFGGALFIPDDQSTCFESEVTYNSLISGAVVTDPSDIANVFVNFEHSYMGDLNISIICPNNQTLLLHDGGGGFTILGEPVEPDSNLDPGVGYDYYWSPDATNGTWGEESGNYATLPSGTYAAAQDWSLLEGCPLNGTWTIQVCDELSSDNGYIFDWAIEFDPSLFEDVISFTPEFGISCDSTFWTQGGELVTSGSENCNEIVANQSVGGDYDYIFNATDNFGCTYKDTVTVSFIDPPEIEINYEEQDLLCNEEVELTAEILNVNPLVDDFEYSWSPGGLVSSDNTLVTTASGYDTTTTFNI